MSFTKPMQQQLQEASSETSLDFYGRLARREREDAVNLGGQCQAYINAAVICTNPFESGLLLALAIQHLGYALKCARFCVDFESYARVSR